MKKINTNGWKNFKIEDLFNKCELKCKKGNFNKAFDVSQVQTSEFTLPLVNAKHSNNGIMYYGRESDFESEEMTIDIVADGAASTGDIYAQPQKTGVLYNAYLVKPKFKATKNILLFVSRIMQTTIKKQFGYENKCTWKKVKNLEVLLPAKQNEPNWEYIETYMENILQVSERKINNLQNINNCRKNINLNNWKAFKLGDLFKIKSAKGKNSQQLNDGNDIPYIAASKERNGYNRMVSAVGFEDWISEGNCIQLIHIGDAAAGYANYIPDRFIAMNGKSSCAYNNKMTKYSGLFIASIICKTNIGKYSFEDSWTGDKVANTIIKLPAQPNGEPDWEYMENYMKNIMANCESKLDDLESCI